MSAPAGMVIAFAAMLLRSDIAQPIRVIDGDTLRRDGVVYRLAGFDAPEIARAGCAEERALGVAAKARMEEIASDPAAIIEPLPAREKFGRTLARLWIGSEDAASIMIREGLALPYDGHAKASFCQPSVSGKTDAIVWDEAGKLASR